MEFLPAFRERVAHLRAIHKEGVLGRWIGAIWLLVGIVSLTKTEFLSPKLQEEWQFIHVIPAMSLATWATIFALVLFCWAVEASFRHAKKMQAIISELESSRAQKVDEPTDEDKRRLELLKSLKLLYVRKNAMKLSDEFMAGLEDVPPEWINEQLRQRGETWHWNPKVGDPRITNPDASGLYTTLKVDLHQTDRGQIRSHRIGITNQGAVVAKNVKVWLRDISPKVESFRNDFPYRVAKADAVWTVYSTLPIEDVDVNPKEEELFHSATSWPLDDGFYIARMDTKKHGESYGIRLLRGQELLLRYEITSGNAPSVQFSFTAAPNADFTHVDFVRTV